MFLCETCHEESTCRMGLIELQSRGPCERCRDLKRVQSSAVTTDCHRYNFSGLSDAEIDAKVKATLLGRGELMAEAEITGQTAEVRRTW